VPFEDPEEAALYAHTILLRDHVARMPEALGVEYARAVVAEAIRAAGTPFQADYVRLDLWALR